MSNIKYRGTNPTTQTPGLSSDELTIAEMDNNFYALDVTTAGTVEALKAIIPNSSAQITGGLNLVTTTNLVVTRAAPSSAGDTGTAGEIAIANGFLYVCVATDTWQRVAIATWP